MRSVTLVTGGCRSGKSSHALEIAARLGKEKRLFIATCVARDDEMQMRVEKHRQERGDAWETVECPVDIAGAINGVGKDAVAVIDCLTLWISNLLEQTSDEALIMERVRSVQDAIGRAEGDIVMVTNEVGCGIVPENGIARVFRDIMGMVNSSMASFADTVVWMVAGVPVVIKGVGR